MISREATDKIIRAKPEGETLADWIFTEMERIEAIKRAIASIEIRKREAKAAFNKVVKDLDLEAHQIQAKCKHEDTKHYGDPSGGSDSHTQCNTCGREVSRSEHCGGYDG